MNTINETNFQFPKQKDVYKGKVREVYNIDDKLLVMIAYRGRFDEFHSHEWPVIACHGH